MQEETKALKLYIDYEFVDMNRYINIERANKYEANYVKQCEKKAVCFMVRKRYTGKYPVTLTIRPHFKDKRRDLDNYRIKGLIDGLVAANVIKNDNLNCINKIILEPVFTEEPGVEVEIEETGARND